MTTLLNIHYVVGFLVVIASLALIWRRPGRRLTLYVLTLQILLGIALLAARFYVPPVHWILGVLAWGLYMGANAVGRRPGKGRIGLALAVAATLLVLGTFGIGQHAAMHPALHDPTAQ